MIAAIPRTVRRNDSGQATLEQAGLAGAVIVLLTALASVLGPGGEAGARLAGSLGERIVGAVAQDDSKVSLGQARVHEAHRLGTTVGTGSRAPRLTDLQMHEIGPQVAWRTWSGERSYSTTPATSPKGPGDQLPGAAGTVEGTFCVLCLGTSARAQYALGGVVHGAARNVSSSDLLGVDALARAHLALVHATASATGALQGFGIQIASRTTTTGTAGFDGSLAAQLELGRLHQALMVEAGAMAGLGGRIEQRASVRLAGVAVEATAGADGWVGAGLTGRAHIGHEGGGRFSWDFGAGAALGLGGGAHVAGMLDLSGLLHQHPGLVTGVISTSLSGLPAGSAAPALARIATTASTRHDRQLTRKGAGQ